MDFVAVDVETANPDRASICQIGIAQYVGGILTNEWKSYVDPEDYFGGIEISIHGIDESVVKGSPTFKELVGTVDSFLNDSVVVSHTSFDRVSVAQAYDKCGVRAPKSTWLDTARIARRTWERFARQGYGLSNICETLGYAFKAHDALEDAKASAYIFISASKETGHDIEGWIERIEQPIDPTAGSSRKAVQRDGNPAGPLFGEVLVFTGELELPRHEAADMAAAVGCRVAGGVTKSTTMLVVGDQDVRKLAGRSKSRKHEKAEMLIERGIPIRILRETDFKVLVHFSRETR